MNRSILAVAAAIVLAAPVAHAAGPQEGAFSMSFFGGIDQPLSGDVHDGATAAVPASTNGSGPREILRPAHSRAAGCGVSRMPM